MPNIDLNALRQLSVKPDIVAMVAKISFLLKRQLSNLHGMSAFQYSDNSCGPVVAVTVDPSPRGLPPSDFSVGTC